MVSPSCTYRHTLCLFLRYFTLYLIDYWCISGLEHNEWTELLRWQPDLVAADVHKLTHEQLFNAFDFNCDGVVNLHEFILGMTMLGYLPKMEAVSFRQKVFLIFMVFDGSEQGYITGLQFYYLAR